MEDVKAYITETEDELTIDEIEETDDSITEIDRGEFVSWEEIKSLMKQWRER